MHHAAALLGSNDREQVERFVATLDAIDQGLQIVSDEWRYLFMNNAVVRQARQTRESMLGRTMQDCFPGIEQSELFTRLREAMVTRRSLLFENQFAYPDGSTGWFEVRAEPHERGLIIFTTDITARKQLEVQFLHAQKLEVIGRLAGGVAHDFNNLLSVILIGVQMVLDDLDPASKHRAELQDVFNAGERAAALTRQLLAFSRNQVTQLRHLDLNVAVGELQRMLNTLVGESVALTIVPSETPLVVRADRNLLEQVFLNLVVNARDAMQAGGTIVVTLSRSNGFALISVHDDGKGMDAATRARVFEPFFTTKERGKGTGLGLSTVFDVVTRLAGAIDVQSEPGKGATFTVSLPLAPGGTLPEATPPFIRAKPAQKARTILVVDDDRAVLNAACAVLRGAGYVVHAASSADEASQVAADLPVLSLLLTDVVMRGRSGRELADELRFRRPNLPVLFMSGYSDDQQLEQRVLETGFQLIDKPLVPEKLLAHVERMFD